jgi:DNA-binding XRE family transcriptional regulator
MTSSEIRDIRERLGLTQHEFAQLLDVGRTTVVNWERGRTNPPELKKDMIRRLGAEAEKRRNEEWVRALLGLAAAGAFGSLLGKLFGPNDQDE